MADSILMAGCTGGVSSDDVTAGKAQVLQGYKTVTTDSDDEPIEGTIPNRGHRGANTDDFSELSSFGGYVVGFAEGYYKNEDGRQPYVVVPTATVKQAVGYNPDKTLNDTVTCGERGTIPVRGYHGPDSSEMWLYLQEGGYVVRIEEGYYHKGGQWKPYVIVPTSLAKSAVNYRPEKTLDDTVTCDERGQIPVKPNENMTIEIVNINWTNPKKFGFRFQQGYYPNSGQYSPIVEVNYGDLANALGIRADKMLNDINILGIQGNIPYWVCHTGDVISAVNNEGFAWDDTYAGRGRGIVVKIANGHVLAGANYVFLPSPNLQPWNIRQNVNVNGITGTMVDYSVGRPVFENATFNTLYVGGVANKDFPEAKIYRERTQSHNNYSKYIGGTTIDVRASSNYHLSAFSNYVGFILDRAILFTFFRQLKVTYKLNMNMHTGRYNRTAGVNIFVFIYDANNRSRNIGGNQATHRSGDNIESVHNENTYELIVDTSTINQDGFVALCADAYSDDNLSSAIGNVTFTKIELIN